MVTVRIAETYDLHTVQNTVSLIGIHTPGTASIRRQYGGFLDNYKFMRLKGCNVTCACASYLPADPLQVGFETGKIAPQDMFNPILYKAVSNTAFETLVSSLYSNAAVNYGTDNSVNGIAVAPGNEGSLANVNSWDLYYAILGYPGWKKAMPQAGFSMRGLRPFVHSLASTFGNVNNPLPNAGNMNNLYASDFHGDVTGTINVPRIIRGKAFPLGKIPTRVQSPSATSKDFQIPTTWVGVCVLPPYAMNTLYYRLRVVWSIEFFTPRSTLEYEDYDTMAFFGDEMYYCNYNNFKSNMDATTNTVDTIGAEIEKIMDA